MAKNKVRQITIKTVKKSHLHTCGTCHSDDVDVISKYLAHKFMPKGIGVARCLTCKSIREF